MLRVGRRQNTLGFQPAHRSSLASGLRGLDKLPSPGHHGGVRGSHVDGVNPNSVGRVVEGGVAGEAGDPVLAGHVGRVACQPGLRGDGPNIDDRSAPALFYHLAQFRSQGLEHPGGIGGHHRLPVFIGSLVDGVGEQLALSVEI